MENKVTVEIWSDVMCPFCYIGKRKFETALESLPQKNNVEVIWKSFQLNPELKYQPGVDAYSYLAKIKGQTREWSVSMHQSVIQSAKNVGLDFNFDTTKITNSFDAHRVIQLAKKHNLGNEMEEQFFKAYFTDGELMSDHETLIRLATEVGIDKEEVTEVLSSNEFEDYVKMDVAMAEEIGIRGVPFFVLNRKYAVSGAQDASVFAGALQKAFEN